MSRYKILATDLDGTLLNGDSTISTHTLDTLLRAEREGLRVVVSSGRPAYGVRRVCDALQLAHFGGYAVCYNGGQIVDVATGETIHANTLDKSFVPLLAKRAKEAGFDILTYHGDSILTTATERNEYAMRSSRRNEMKLCTVDDFVKAVDEVNIYKCMIVGHPEPLHRFELKLAEEMKGRMGIFRSDEFFLEAVPLGVDKAEGLKALLKQLGLTADELIACGDAYNDMGMIKLAGLGVAMNNAAQPVKDCADYITLSNNEDGVADVVEKFFF